MNVRREAWLSLLLLAGILFEGNALIGRFPVRLDLTRTHMYTLSPSTEKVLKSLDSPVRAVLYVSAKLPPALLPIKEQTLDLLSEYATRSGRRFRFEVVDPSRDPDRAREAERMGVQRIQFNVMEKDELKVVEGYFGLVLLYADKREVIPVIQDPAGLEYEITSRLLKMTRTDRPVIGLWVVQTDHARDYQMLEQELRKTYDVRRVYPPYLPESVDLFVIVGWKDFTDSTVAHLREALNKGKRVVWFLSPAEINLDNLYARPLPAGALDSLKALLNFPLKSEMLLDLQSEVAQFQSGYMGYLVRYPYWVRVQGDGINRTHPVTRLLESVVMPWACPFPAPDSSGRLSGWKATVLLRSSKQSWRVQPPYVLSPSPAGFQPDTFRPAPLALILEGDSTTVALVGSAYAVMDPFLRMFPENGIFAMNLVDALAFGDELLEIRAKEGGYKPLPLLSDTKKFWLKTLNTYGMAFLVLLFGMVHLARRRKRGGEA